MRNTKNILLSLGAGMGALWIIYSVVVTVITMAENGGITALIGSVLIIIGAMFSLKKA